MNVINELKKEHKGKVLLNSNILSSKYKIKKHYLLLPLLTLIIFLLNKKYFLYFILTIFSGVFAFYHDKYNRTPIDFKLPLFLGIFITRHYGLLLLVVFFILADFIPSLIGGGEVEGASFFYIGWYFIVNIISYFFPETNIILLGIAMVVLEGTGSIFIANTVRGFPGLLGIAVSFFTILARIGYFLTLGVILNYIFQIIL